MTDGFADTSLFVARESGQPLRTEALRDRLAASRPHAATVNARIWVAMVCSFALVACSPAPSSSPSTSSTTIPSPAASDVPSATPSASSAPVITWCPITLGDGSAAPAGTQPRALPRALPTDLIRAGDTVYGVAFPSTWRPRPALYALGPAGGQCGVDVGIGLFWRVDGATDVPFTYDEPWGDLPMKALGCRYLESARAAYMTATGVSAIPAACATIPDFEIVAIPAAVEGLALALVSFGTPDHPGPTVSLYGYRPADAPGGEVSWQASCRTDAGRTARCAASLAFIAATYGGGRQAVTTILDAFARAH